MRVLCPVTQQDCKRDCSFPTQCILHALKQGEDIVNRRHAERRKELATQESYFIPSPRLGAIEGAATTMLANANKRARRVDLNHIQQVLKTLKLIPHGSKVVAIGLGCLDTGESGLLVLCASPIQVQGDIP